MPLRPSKSTFAALAFACVLGPFSGAQALEAYSEEQKTTFLDWCTGAKTQSESVCSCALKQVTGTVAPAALMGFLNQQSGSGGFSLSTTAITVGTAVAQALATCNQ